ncbi:MAG TPA: hypothetical protein VL860_09755 [Planctomycetota bacterium]|nr:hypothetical protein [Planctomycetota bacterium]
MSAADSTQAGLCAICRHLKRIDSCRGPVYFQCQLSLTDKQYPRYPRLPVINCTGFSAVGSSNSAAPR